MMTIKREVITWVGYPILHENIRSNPLVFGN